MYCFISQILGYGRVKSALLRDFSPLLGLAVLHAAVLGAGFFAPYSYETQNRTVPFAPPTRIHFFDQRYQFHVRPFVYGRKSLSAFAAKYEEDQSVQFPIYFFVSGTKYRFLGLIPISRHLFGVGPEEKLFLLGTDGLGRDEFSRLLYGGQISLFAGLLGASLSVGIGTVLGTLAGYYGTWIDEIIMRAAEMFLAVPWLYLLLAIRAVLPLHLSPGSVFMLIIFVSGLIGWGRPARLVRGIVLRGRDREYVLAAKGFGASDFYVLRTHILPLAYGVAITQAMLYVPQYITSEAVLSFFGLGVSEPVPSWGNMLAQLRTLYVLETCWWMFTPAVALVAVLTLFEWAVSGKGGSLFRNTIKTNL